MNCTSFSLLVLFLFCYSCSNSDPTKNQIESTASFVANPQPVLEQTVSTLSIGSQAPDFNLPSTDGAFYSLDDFKNSEALVVIFTCNHCPTAQAYEDRLISVAADYHSKEVAFVAISPTSPLGLLYEELGYSDLNDDFEEMKIRASDKKFNFPYLYDGDNQAVSLKYGPVATPHAFLFDKDRKLVYRGRLDKIEKPGMANAEDLRSSLDAVLEGKAVPEPTTKTFGCSTKWGWKLKMKKKVNDDWQKKKVTLEEIDQEGIQTLIKNKDSNKLQLINIWATWCGPCILEYPDLITVQRMYGARDFEFISISADNIEDQEKALKFLQEKNSALTNYIFTGKDKYELIEAVDADWNGALPYTMLIEPNGKVVWKHQGTIDFYQLKRTIVEHELIGRYY